ncbi:unnamed protein product [Mytilus coruscus]|uniref:Uncharacterized protein n=1 Tax=Mytilus coruscus TaxID=42192 RepID=A0A6J8EA08_MYTCO|nr:unnamed protein product [Mytilus coruscus]
MDNEGFICLQAAADVDVLIVSTANLHEATKAGDLEKVREYLSRGADINDTDWYESNGETRQEWPRHCFSNKEVKLSKMGEDQRAPKQPSTAVERVIGLMKDSRGFQAGLETESFQTNLQTIIAKLPREDASQELFESAASIIDSQPSLSP